MVVFVTVGAVWPNALGCALYLALLAGGVWTVFLLSRHHTGAVLYAGVTVALTVGLPALWLAGRHITCILSWLRWRNRPLPAMRLTADGLDYSPAYTGDFPLHVNWLPVLESHYRRGADNTGFVWCLYSPAIDGVDPLPSSIHREWPLDARRLWGELRHLVGVTGMDERSPVQMAAALHLIHYGTPVALNLYYTSGTPLAVVDAYLRERTDGRCTLQPPDEKIPPTTRVRAW
ncbi:hypothetical protein ACFU3O_14505 [Streptomyces antibioticus]|uniref:hypothetical protein n=1 Tax=Streptomyces antibioticus TaxID=1890 RepID=UPI0036C9A035